MGFCGKCGFKLDEGFSFCPRCGASTDIPDKVKARSDSTAEAETEVVLAPEPEPEVQQIVENAPEPKPVSRDEQVRHCPACGEVVGAGDVVCPTCGFELRDVANGSIAQLSEKLEAIERGRPEKTLGEAWGSISATDEKKINLIRTWPIPNVKEDLVEFLIMASGNCVPAARWRKKAAEDALTQAWRSKFDQAYAKAEMKFGDTAEFGRIRSLKSEVQKKTTLAKSKSSVLRVVSIPFIFLGILILWLMASSILHTLLSPLLLSSTKYL